MTYKPNACHVCGKRFRKVAGVQAHWRDVHKGKPAPAKTFDTTPMPNMPLEARRAILDSMDDVSDGVFFAMAEELGIDLGDEP